MFKERMKVMNDIVAEIHKTTRRKQGIECREKSWKKNIKSDVMIKESAVNVDIIK